MGHPGVLNESGRARWVADEDSREFPGLSFFGQNSSLYGNMNIRRAEARRLTAAIAADRGFAQRALVQGELEARLLGLRVPVNFSRYSPGVIPVNRLKRNLKKAISS